MYKHLSIGVCMLQVALLAASVLALIPGTEIGPSSNARSDNQGREDPEVFSLGQAADFAGADRDGDGVLGILEFTALEKLSREDRLAGEFSRMDRDSDGYIDAEEYVARHPRETGQTSSTDFALADLDGNGRLGPKELAVLWPPDTGYLSFSRLDRNADEGISLQEFHAEAPRPGQGAPSWW